MARPFFARERISDFDNFERSISPVPPSLTQTDLAQPRHTNRTLTLLSSLASSDQPCEAQDLFARFSLDAASEFLFGTNLDTLSGALPAPGAATGAKGSATGDAFGSFTQGFECAQTVATTRGRLGHYFWPVAELFGDRSLDPQRTIRRWLDPLVERSLDEKRRAQRVGARSPIEEKTFLQHLAESTEG
jgi:hypothetical protein